MHNINDEVTTDLNGEAVFSYTGFNEDYDKITFKIGSKKKKGLINIVRLPFRR